LRTGKITSDLIEIKASQLAVPALVQATSTKQFDIVLGPAVGFLNAYARGVPLSILATGTRYKRGSRALDLWTRNDSGIRTPADLKGKTVGVVSLNATAVALIRLSLWKETGLNTAIEGGDIKFVELPATALPAALESGRIDAAHFIQLQAFQAERDKSFTSVFQGAAKAAELLEGEAISSFLLGYTDRINARPQAYREFARVMKEISDYVETHLDELIPIVAKSTKQDPAFFKVFFERYSAYPGRLTATDLRSTSNLWTLSKEFGLIKDHPKIKDVVWSGVTVE